MRRELAIALAAAAAWAGAALAQERGDVPAFRTYGAPASAADAAAIDALVATFKDAWGREDVDALMALHAEDVEWINAYARMFQGAAPLADFLEDRLFPAFAPGVSAEEAANMRLISIRYLGENAAVAHLYTEGARGASRNADEELRRTHLHFVLGKDGEAWRIEHAAIMDARR